GGPFAVLSAYRSDGDGVIVVIDQNGHVAVGDAFEQGDVGAAVGDEIAAAAGIDPDHAVRAHLHEVVYVIAGAEIAVEQGGKIDLVLAEDIVGDGIDIVRAHFGKDEGVVARSAGQRVVARATDQDVIAVAADKEVVAIAALQRSCRSLDRHGRGARRTVG